MNREQIVSVVVSAIFVLACALPLAHGESDLPSTAQVTKAEEAPPAEADESPKYPVIGRLETREGTIVIMSGPDGPLYDVKGKGGSVVSRALSEKELRAQHPHIYDRIKGALAGGVVWAGM